MDKYKTKTTFQQWFSPISLKNLSQKAQMGIKQFNRYSKKLSFDSFLKLFTFAVNEELESLRHIDESLLAPELQAAVDLESISYSQLSRKLTEVDPHILEEIFHQLLSQVHQATHKQRQKALYLVDSTTFSLNKTRYPWAEFRKTKSGIKLHLKLCFMDKGHTHPEQFELSNASEHDDNHLEAFINQPLATYVFDRGYLNFDRLEQMHWQGYFFVTRIKKNTIVHEIESFDVNETKGILADQIVHLGSKTALTSRFRLITIERPGDIPLRVVTNRFDVTAETISDMYKSRWQIELFFKHIKQHFTIKNFYSRSEKGVTNQVLIALISYLLTYIIKLSTGTNQSTFNLLRKIRILMFRNYELLIKELEPT